MFSNISIQNEKEIALAMKRMKMFYCRWLIAIAALLMAGPLSAHALWYVTGGISKVL
jgi:hypothetical protein